MLKAGLTTFERGEIKGRRELARKLLETKFGPLPEPALRRLEEWPAERLDAVGVALLGDSPTLANLGLVDEPTA